MGLAKDYQARVEERGWSDVGTTVCSRCVIDDALSQAIRNCGQTTECSYCGQAPTAPEASAPIETVLEHIVEGLRYEYEDPAEGMAWEGGWQGAPVYDTWDLLYELEVTENSELHRDLAGAIEQDQWCQRDPYAATPAEALTWGWQSFREYVKHERRYTFFLKKPGPAPGAGELAMHQVLESVASAIETAGLVSPLPSGTEWWRARVHGPGERFTSAADIGSPPASVAKDNRMSPKGISVFYGASSLQGAQDEVAGYADPSEWASAGRFDTTTPLTIVDLREPPRVPSLFSADRALRPATQFLRAFISDATRVADPSDTQNLDYVPTQIVAEYLCQALGGDHGRVRGLLWRSSKDDAVTSCVLFVPAEEVADAGVAGPGARLVLDHTTVTLLAAPLGDPLASAPTPWRRWRRAWSTSTSAAQQLLRRLTRATHPS